MNQPLWLCRRCLLKTRKSLGYDVLLRNRPSLSSLVNRHGGLPSPAKARAFLSHKASSAAADEPSQPETPSRLREDLSSLLELVSDSTPTRLTYPPPQLRKDGVSAGNRASRKRRSRAQTRATLQKWLDEQLSNDQAVHASMAAADAAISPGATSQKQELADIESITDASPVIEPDDELTVANVILRPGDIVELIKSGVATLGIYVGPLGIYSAFYTMNGDWDFRGLKRIRYHSQDNIPRSLAEPLQRYLPPDTISPTSQAYGFFADVPDEVARPVLERLIKFWKQSEDTYRRFSTPLDNAHDIIAYENTVRIITLSSIADAVFGDSLPPQKRTAADMYALHKAITRPPSRFIPESTWHYRSNVFVVRSKLEVRLFQDVERWFREYQDGLLANLREEGSLNVAEHPMRRFLNKARKLITKSRRMRTPTAMKSIVPLPDSEPFFPPRPVETGVEFDEADRSIIAFFEDWVSKSQLEALAGMNPLGSQILRATGMYEDYMLDHGTGFLFLQEIGAWTPWDYQGLIRDSFAARVKPETMIYYDSFAGKLTDSMEHLRRDWGDLQAYSVDAPGTVNVEDAFSVERVSGDEERYWVHVHIAHPTAFIPLDHPLALRAARQGKTMFMPDGCIHMLPQEVATAHTVIGPDRPVLTFSALVDGDCEILDSRITPGILRNVTHVSLRAFNALSPVQPKLEKLYHKVGGDLPKHGQIRRNWEVWQLPASQQVEIGILARLAEARYSRRTNLSKRYSLGSDLRIIDAYDGREDGHSVGQIHQRARFWQGDPAIKMSVIKWESIDPKILPMSVVSEMMALASQLAGRWCMQRNIPVPYRGTVPGKTSGEHLHGYFASPVEHKTLGMDVYIKVTAPARRFLDMLSHWQIDAALRYEAAHAGNGDGANSSPEAAIYAEAGKRSEEGAPTEAENNPRTATAAESDASNSGNSKSLEECLPFSKRQLHSRLAEYFLVTRRFVERQGALQRHWIAHFLARAYLREKSEPPPPTFTCFVVYRAEYLERVLAYVKQLHTVVRLSQAPELLGEPPNMFDEFEAQLESVNLHTREIDMRATRLTRRAADQSEEEMKRMNFLLTY